MVDLRAVPAIVAGRVRAVVAGLVAGRVAARLAKARAGGRGRSRPELSWLLGWLVPGLLALGLLPLNVALPVESFGVYPLVGFLVGIAQSTALALVPVRPRAATALQLLAVVVLAVALRPDSGSTWPLSVPGMITLIAHLALIAVRYSRSATLTSWWTSVLVLVLVVVLDPRQRSVPDGLGVLILYPIFSGLVLGAVLLNARWREVRRELADARHDVEVEQSQRAVAEERTRIARELHDVVAHSMSVIHMQATSASYRIDGLDPAAKAEFAQIAAGARGTLRELRQLLAVLRDERADAELAPVPDLSRLPELVVSAERAGVPVELEVTVDPATVPESVALAAFRIVQESLSNVIRHAPGALTRVHLGSAACELVVSVENDVATQEPQAIDAPGRAGHGLAGMRERARLAGGSVQAGARAGGGYRVRARLPMGGPE